MKSLIEAYDHYLKERASVPPARRLSVTYKVALPWVAAVTAVFLLVRGLGLSRSIETWIVVPTICVCVVGIIYAGRRVAKYGWLLDRTPTDPDLIKMQGSDVLLNALRRVTLNGLSNLTLATRLRSDLRLTPADVSQLLSLLAAEDRLDAQTVEALKFQDMTVEGLLQKMS
jgi:hypothetical protein